MGKRGCRKTGQKTRSKATCRQIRFCIELRDILCREHPKLSLGMGEVNSRSMGSTERSWVQNRIPSVTGTTQRANSNQNEQSTTSSLYQRNSEYDQQRGSDPGGRYSRSIHLYDICCSKSHGGFRPVFNLKRLNKYIKSEHFKMESIQQVKSLVQQGNFMITIDLKDAYFMIAVHAPLRKFLRFRWDNVLFEFQVVPFGLKTAQRLFTKLMKPVVSHLRHTSMKVVIYLDDLLLISQSRAECREQAAYILHMFSSLGLMLNWKKSQLIPATQTKFLGHIIDSQEMTLSLPGSKIDSLVEMCTWMAENPVQPAETLASLIGKMNATAEDVVPAPVFFRALQADLIQSVRIDPTYQSLVSLSQDSLQELQWWKHCLRQYNGKPIVIPHPQLTITSDASTQGWGAHCQFGQTGGRWTQVEGSNHINYLELLAAFLALQAFARDKADCQIMLRLDNTTALAHIKHKGGTRTGSLTQLAVDMWKWCLARNIILTASHVPGVDNIIADQHSRVFVDRLEWMLECSRDCANNWFSNQQWTFLHPE